MLVSGSGSNLQALIDAGIPIAAVAANVDGRAGPRAGRARSGSRPRCSRSTTTPDRDARDAAMADWLVEHGVGLVVCAGYMHLLTAGVPRPLPR